ncbi:MAG: HlyC/CorC family transporter, partial [Deltaproteobacteria bacterium]|nr:HlyC/CorC family transporter [Deltaproteobacteria bacterium]
NPEKFLATVQVAVTIVGTLASVIGGVLAIELIKPLLEQAPMDAIRNASEFLAVSAVVVILSYAILVFGELTPKSLALRYPEKIACMSAKPLSLLSKVSGIFVGILTMSTSLTLRIFGVKGKARGVFVSEEEIKYIISEGRAKGVLEETEAELIHGVLEFADTTAKDIMVPKHKISGISIDSPSSEAISHISKTGDSRYPVYEDNLNKIRGILFNKDVFKYLEKGFEVDVRELMREPYFVPNSIMISRLLREMQRKKMHIAIVANEHGEVDGIITIEDVIEEIVGEIEDEYDVEKGGLIEKLKDGTLIVDPSATLSDLSDVGLTFTEDDMDRYTNLASFMLSRLQRIPRGGEFIVHESKRFTVVDMEGRRIAKVKVEILNGDKKKSDSTHLKKVSG